MCQPSAFSLDSSLDHPRTGEGRRGRRACGRLLALLVTAIGIAACGGKSPDSTITAVGASDAALPKPEQSAGSITGMAAAPGPGAVPITGAPPAPTTSPQDQVDLLNPETGALPGGAVTPADGSAEATTSEPTAQDAVAVVRDYYASIDGRSYARAYALWSDGGKASRQTPQQFAAGFASTTRVTVDTGTPGDEEAGAGQRYIRVPVAIAATQADGSTKRYDGTYTLHRTVADGATGDQRAWRIASAELRELQP